MKCANCGISIDETPLIRINKKGEHGIFWCEMCIKENGLPYEEKFFEEVNIIHELTHKGVKQ